MHIVDLAMPIAPHFRWPVELQFGAPRNLFSAAPLLIPNADDAPARIYAIEGLPF